MTGTMAVPRSFGPPFGERPTLGALTRRTVLVELRLDELRHAYRRHHRWLASVQRSLGGAPGPDDGDVKMPGKASKHRMYATAGDLVRVCGWGLGEQVSPGSLYEIALLIAGVERILRGDPVVTG